MESRVLVTKFHILISVNALIQNNVVEKGFERRFIETTTLLRSALCVPTEERVDENGRCRSREHGVASSFRNFVPPFSVEILRKFFQLSGNGIRSITRASARSRLSAPRGLNDLTGSAEIKKLKKRKRRRIRARS